MIIEWVDGVSGVSDMNVTYEHDFSIFVCLVLDDFALISGDGFRLDEGKVDFYHAFVVGV